MNALDVAREYFPYLLDEELEGIIWNETGYPCFWSRGDTPEGCFRLQLAKFKCRIEFIEHHRNSAELMRELAIKEKGGIA